MAGAGAQLVEEADRLLALFRAAGLQAAMDDAELNPPGVLLSVPVPALRFGGCSGFLWTVLLVAPAVGRYRALPILGKLLDDVLDVLDGGPITDIRAVDLIPANGEPLPAFSLTYATTAR